MGVGAEHGEAEEDTLCPILRGNPTARMEHKARWDVLGSLRVVTLQQGCSTVRGAGTGHIPSLRCDCPAGMEHARRKAGRAPANRDSHSRPAPGTGSDGEMTFSTTGRLGPAGPGDAGSCSLRQEWRGALHSGSCGMGSRLRCCGMRWRSGAPRWPVSVRLARPAPLFVRAELCRGSLCPRGCYLFPSEGPRVSSQGTGPVLVPLDQPSGLLPSRLHRCPFRIGLCCPKPDRGGGEECRISDSQIYGYKRKCSENRNLFTELFKKVDYHQLLHL
ncbi:otolin-1 [Platysternon megacephalum]|uniref:Otolin-1 n=1 Tax=Platysternon megacephalum TaxID=55544 RepID=A0A4D9F0I1_9SAUR|nr:otolin-1 [Platysternon megacephalum]